MAENQPRPNSAFERLTGAGKFTRRPTRHYESATVLTIDFERLAARLKNRLSIVFGACYAIREQMHHPTTALVDGELEQCIGTMVDMALFIAYNRLRTVADRYSSATRTNRMNPRAPVSSEHEFPTFLASMLQSIGPLRIEDGLEDILVIYATDADRANHYGRAAAVAINYGRLDKITAMMKRANVPMSKIDTRVVTQGSFFTTVIPTLDHNQWTFTATQPPHHYEDNDCLRAWLALHDDNNNRCVQYCGLIIEKNTTTAITTAVTNSRPANVAAGYDGATSAPDPLGLVFNANMFGVLPAVAAQDQVPAVPAAVYLLGRGTTTYNTTVIGSLLSEDDMIQWAQSTMY